MNPDPTPRLGPSPDQVHPLFGVDRLVFLKNIVKNPRILVGDYTYYDDPQDPTNFERNVLYHFDFIGDRLIIGKFCAIATGVTFIMNGGNHSLTGFSTYPFEIFGQGWESAEADSTQTDSTEADPTQADLTQADLTQADPADHPEDHPRYHRQSDTIIGNDVWIGYGATLLPGVKVGNGAVIGAKSVVTKAVEPYAIVGGNPARLIRHRFDPETVRELEEIAWWDWDIAKITQHRAAITQANLAALRQASPGQQ